MGVEWVPLVEWLHGVRVLKDRKSRAESQPCSEEVKAKQRARNRQRRAREKELKAQDAERIKRQARAAWEARREAARQAFPKVFALIERPGFTRWYEAQTGEPWNPEWEGVEIHPRASELPHAPDACGVVYHIAWLLKRREAKRADLQGQLALIDYLDASDRRRVRQAVATPPWFSQSEVERVYAKRDELNRRFPEHAPFHVDHIVPIQGEGVCGLHVQGNLRVIPGRENCQKNNRHDPDVVDVYCWSRHLNP